MTHHDHVEGAARGLFFSDLLKVFTPRSQCMDYEAGVIWLHFASDILIALAYYSIPVALIHFALKRKDLGYNKVCFLFAIFIILCGTTHVFNVLALSTPVYRLDGLVKLATGLVSIGTAIMLWRLMPQALALPSAAELTRNRDELERLVGVRTQELVETNRALGESEVKFRQLAESIPQLAWMARPNGHIFWFNQRWFDYTGTNLDQMQGDGWRSVHDPEFLPKVVERWRLSIDTGIPFDMVFPIRGADGKFRRFLTRVEPLRDPEGNVFLWLGTNTDVEARTLADEERARLLEETQAARADSEAANRMKDEFLAILSHELRTPLNAIVGWAHLLRMGKPDPEDLQEGLEVIDRNAKTQSRIIEDLLDVSRIISGKLTLDIQRIGLSDVIDAAVASIRSAANAREIQIVESVDPLAGPILGDPARLQQVVWNLLSNAVKFTPKGGTVSVSVGRVNSHIEISVSDSGMGISPEFLPHIFERFRQADSTTTRRFGGLGLGLAIVKQLTELQGGTVHAESPGEGQGATFTVRLPVSAVLEHQAVRHPRTAPDGRRVEENGGLLKGLRVLVVDDEPDARQLVRKVLTSYLAEVAMAGSAREAIELIRSFKPNVLVSDVGMPEQDGYELLRQVRTQRTAAELPAAALTAFARGEDRTRALLAGFQTHVVKPVDPAELVAVVASLAGRTGPTPSVA